MIQETFTLEDKTIGIIGFGNFGKVISQYLFPKNQQVIYSSRGNPAERGAPTIKPVDTIQELVEASDIIIPAVPIRNFETVIKEIAEYVKPGQIVIDVCSVKEIPVEIMKKYLHDKSNIIATHPMFGPNSITAQNNIITGLKMVMYNVRMPEYIYDSLQTHFTDLGLDIIQMTPQEHDRLSAHSQFVALIIGEIGKTLDLQPTAIDTPGAAAIIDALQYMGPDRHIIEDMITYNVYCKTVLEQMTEILGDLKKEKGII